VYLKADIRKLSTTRRYATVGELRERTYEVGCHIVDIDFKLKLTRSFRRGSFHPGGQSGQS
jgi:hypothetical protein